MQIYTRYKVALRRWRWRTVGYVAAGLAGLGLLAWMFWRTAQDIEPSARPGTPVVRTNRPAGPNAPTVSRGPTPPAAVTNPPAPRVVISTNLVIRTNPVPAQVALPFPTATNRAGFGTNAPGIGAARPGTTNATSIIPVAPVLQAPRDALELQLALARAGFSPGSIDGTIGSQTRSALRAFQRRERLPATGQFDEATRARLAFAPPAYATVIVTGSDLAELRPLSPTWLGKSQQDRLGYENVLELVAERARTHPGLIRRLNPQVDWLAVLPGLSVVVPRPQPLPAGGRAARIRISLSERTLEALGADGQVLAHDPCSIARLVEKRPVGELRVVVVIPRPSYTFNPEVFPESPEARQLGRKLILPPGPNNPVGTVWIGLDRPGYGIHGTPRPEEVGRTESHGCFRLANWNVEHLATLVTVGTPVLVEP